MINSMKNIHVIPHTHWDREWYFTAARSEIFFMNNFLDVIETLEEYSEFKYFILDGQTSLLDDYIKFRPEDKKRISDLVKAGRLIIGPWYTQSDQMLISGESIVRNLQQGIKTALEYGDYQEVAYVPDSFGQSAAMPQIYNEFGLDKTLFWRGVTDEMTHLKEFVWQGNDGSSVLAVQIPNGYYVGGNIPEEASKAAEFWKNEAIGVAGDRTGTSNIYFPNGFDQAPIRKNLPKLLEEQQERDPENNYFISNIEKYFESILHEKNEFDIIHGELTYAKHSRIHKSIYSSRSDIKVLNTISQNYLVNVMEPMLVIADSLGFEYPTLVVEKIWKIMLQNAAHDAIGSCVSDEANETIKMRYKEVLDLARNLVDLYQRKVAMRIENSTGMNLIIYNYLPEELSRTVHYKGFIPYEHFKIVDTEGKEVEYTIVESRDMTNYVLSNRIQLDPSREVETPSYIRQVELYFEASALPSLGYTTYRVLEACGKHSQMQESDFIENDYYRITVNQKGSLDILDKKSKKTYTNQAVIIDNGDGGDSFDYSPPEKDLEVYSTESDFSYTIEKSNLIGRITINYDFVLPYDLEERARGIVSTHQAVTLTVTLDSSEVIDFEFSTNNKVLSHRMVVDIETDIISKQSIADHQFGTIERPVYYKNEMESYYNSVQNEFHLDGLDAKDVPIANQLQNNQGWQQPTIAIEPTQNLVALSDKDYTVAAFPKGVREYEIVGEKFTVIRLTLFRTYGHMGKENLLYRPGRASGEKTIATPDAQLLGKLEFSFGLAYFKGSFDSNPVAKISRLYNTPVGCYAYAEFLNGRLYFSQYPIESDFADSYSLLQVSSDAIVSSITKSSNDNAYLLRLYNGYVDQSSEVKSIQGDSLDSISQVNLLEEEQDSVTYDLSHNKFITYKLYQLKE